MEKQRAKLFSNKSKINVRALMPMVLKSHWRTSRHMVEKQHVAEMAGGKWRWFAVCGIT